jgi:ABC-type Fe3+ transport system substrate-binding protein
MENNMDNARAIVDYAYNDEGAQAREALYHSINDKVMAHIEAKKQEIAQSLLQPQQPDPTATAQDTAIENP